MVAEHVFRTYGHHFITNDAVAYAERYAATFQACLLLRLANYPPANLLYHSASHWVNPGRAYDVLGAQLSTPSIPDALRIRYNAAPAGRAIITTTNAIIRAISQPRLSKGFVQHGGFDLNRISGLTTVIKADPPKYHKAYFAYGRADLTLQEKNELEAVKNDAARFAPYSQAFIGTYLRGADLSKAKALAKHANQNPLAMKRASNLFRLLGCDTPKNNEELLRWNLELVGTWTWISRWRLKGGDISVSFPILRWIYSDGERQTGA